MDNYFDLHFHPLTKNHLGAYDEKVPGKRGAAELTKKVEMSKGFMDYTDEVILRMLESQCCLEYLEKGNVRLGIAAISALELGIASSQSFFSDLMKNNLAKPFNRRYFDVVREGEVSYLNLFLREVEQYPKLRKAGELNFLSRYNAAKKQFGRKPRLVFGIEGGHNLCTKKIGNALEYDTFEDFEGNEFFDPKTKSLKDPSEVLKKLVKAFWDAQMDVLYLTLTHLTHIPEQHLATHAFGTKLLKHPSFYPFGNGLSDLGKEVIKTAYTLEDWGIEKKKPELLIDIKHLSLKSRLDLYKLRESTRDNKEGEKDFTKIPLIATHVGVTGYSINDWKDNLNLTKSVNHVDQGIKTIKISTKPKVAGFWGNGTKTEFTYNPCTINLMDEDIIEVVNSEGIIGVGLDVRLLGDESKTASSINNSEFLSTADFVTHFPYTGVRSLGFADAEEIRSEEAWLKPTKKEMHPLSFCFNIVHILAVIGLKANPQKAPEKYICVGSDFDGFIEPLKVCGNSQQMKDLESNLLKWLPIAAKTYQKENGGAADLFNFTKKKEKLKKVVDAILYKNGEDFLKGRGYFDEADSSKKKQLTDTAHANNLS